MGWVLKEDRLPPKDGWYLVINFIEGTPEMGFFRPLPPSYSTHYMCWKTHLKLEEDFADRCVYVKGKAFYDLNDNLAKNESIKYWYELDPIPELNQKYIET
jgi:hypothetical protein